MQSVDPKTKPDLCLGRPRRRGMALRSRLTLNETSASIDFDRCAVRDSITKPTVPAVVKGGKSVLGTVASVR